MSGKRLFPGTPSYDWGLMGGKVFVRFIKGSEEACLLATIACNEDPKIADMSPDEQSVIVETVIMRLITEGLLREYPPSTIVSVDIIKLLKKSGVEKL